MKNKPLSTYKRKKIIESFCDELTATQAAHRLNLDRNTVNKYFRRIRECIAGYREYQKMRLMIQVMSSSAQALPAVAKNMTPMHKEDKGIPVRIMCIDGQLVTDLDGQKNGTGSAYMMKVSGHFQHLHPLSSPLSDCDDLVKLADDFHSFTQARLKKFFGVREEFAYLYIKEAEFVFNEREYKERERLLNRMAEHIFQ